MIEWKAREQIIKALKSHAQGHIDKHVANVEIHIRNVTGVAEHSDHVETIEKELKHIAEYDDQLEMLNKYFN
tara:strand:- start:247 stop:462 length:216 start_codon:yes stop_codon:yes gene_type:complete